MYSDHAYKSLLFYIVILMFFIEFYYCRVSQVALSLDACNLFAFVSRMNTLVEYKFPFERLNLVIYSIREDEHPAGGNVCVCVCV